MGSILYLIVCLFIGFWGVFCNSDRVRQLVLVACFLLSSSFIFLVQLCLYDIGLAFNVSDPGRYYDVAEKSRNLYELLSLVDGSSNYYYFIVNYLFSSELESPQVSSVLLKISNLSVFLGFYALSTRRMKFYFVELLILFHPYFFVVVVRNVRDLQILGVAFFLLSELSRVRVNRLVYFSYIPLFLMRPFFAVYTLFLQVFYGRVVLNKWHILAGALFGVLSIFVSDIAYLAIVGRIVAAYGYYNDYNATYGFYVESLLSLDRSPSFLFTILGLVVVGFIRFVFTPILPSYFVKYALEQPADIFLMYTKIDMILIFLGVLINVVICVPLFVNAVVNRFRGVPLSIFLCMSLFIVAMYSIFHLGGTDIRIRYSFIFFLLASYIGVASNKLIADIAVWVLPVSFVIFFAPMVYRLFSGGI